MLPDYPHCLHTSIILELLPECVKLDVELFLSIRAVSQISMDFRAFSRMKIEFISTLLFHFKSRLHNYLQGVCVSVNPRFEDAIRDSIKKKSIHFNVKSEK